MKISWENILLPRNPQVVESGLAVHLSIIGEQDKVQFAREVLEDIGIFLRQPRQSSVVREVQKVEVAVKEAAKHGEVILRWRIYK